MLKLLISSLCWTLSPEKAAEAVRSSALAEWSGKYQRGGSPDASAIDRSFRAAVDAGMQRLSSDGTSDAPADSVERLRIHTFAAHYLPVPIYEVFVGRVMRARRALEMGAAIFALNDIGTLRHFPSLTSRNNDTQPKPVLQTVDEIRLRKAWRKSAPLVTYALPPDEIARVFAGFSADDLHEIAHGEDLSDAPLIEAIVRHPLCDWGSACESLHSFSAEAYQDDWRGGKTEESFGANDRALFRAVSVIADRANRGDFRTYRFGHNWNFGPAAHSDGSPNGDHTSHWARWRIAARALRPTEGEKLHPSVTFDGGKILPEFAR